MIDLDAARAARKEAKGKGPVVKFGGKRFTLPAEVPYEVMERSAELQADPSPANVAAVIRALLGEHYEKLMAGNPSMEDLGALLDGVMEEYGLGNSSASSD